LQVPGKDVQMSSQTIQLPVTIQIPSFMNGWLKHHPTDNCGQTSPRPSCFVEEKNRSPWILDIPPGQSPLFWFQPGWTPSDGFA
jgi:hypothetical protein